MGAKHGRLYPDWPLITHHRLLPVQTGSTINLAPPNRIGVSLYTHDKVDIHLSKLNYISTKHKKVTCLFSATKVTRKIIVCFKQIMSKWYCQAIFKSYFIRNLPDPFRKGLFRFSISGNMLVRAVVDCTGAIWTMWKTQFLELSLALLGDFLGLGLVIALSVRPSGPRTFRRAGPARLTHP